MQEKIGSALVWLRNDLRINDHHALFHATQKYQRIVAYYSFDPSQFELTKWGFKKTERYRAQFLIDTVQQLKEDLAFLNITLIVDKESPKVGISRWSKELNITALYFQEEWTWEEKKDVKKF